MGKRLWTSKTFWVNTIYIALAVVNYVMDIMGKPHVELDPVIQTVILGAINWVLRIITKEPIVWDKSKVMRKGNPV